MTTHLINTHYFYILSGPSASGKSTLAKQLINQGLPQEAIVSSDDLRRQILGTFSDSDENGIYNSLYGWQMDQAATFSILEDILKIRFKEKMPTFLDATNLTDHVRASYVNLAKEYGVESKIIIFDTPVDVLKLRLSHRIERFSETVIDKQLENFQKTSKYDYLIVSPNDDFILQSNVLLPITTDVVGDTHGLLDLTIQLLNKSGWIYNGHSFTHSNDNKKLLFLGDVLDRGPHSLELLQVIINTHKNGKAFFVLGNHEQKLINTYFHFKNTGEVKTRSLSSGLTFMSLLKLQEKEQEEIINFLKFAPTHMSMHISKDTLESISDLRNIDSKNILKFAFLHANISYYHPFKIPKDFAIYGSEKKTISDTDEKYNNLFNQSVNEYILIRGHIPNQSEQNSIYSLDNRQAFNGELKLISLDKLAQAIKENNWLVEHKLFKNTEIIQQSNFNFDTEMEKHMNLQKEMTNLVNEGVVHDGTKTDPETGKKIPNPLGLKIYKYKKKVFFKKLWPKYPMLKKARGLVLDAVGNIVVHPFDKIYNYGEYNTGNKLPLDKEVIYVEKKNGFLGNISPHPIYKNELLVTTTGSFDGDSVKMINDLITPEFKQKLLSYFSKNPQTLMFEVIHPEDPHIIEYEQKDNGLWLIGARGLKDSDELLSEDNLDKISQTLNCPRVFWGKMLFKDVLENLKTCKLEGYMIRDAENHDTIMKIKSTYYLTTKFVGRMGPNNIALMFDHPEKFKRDHLDEEFFPVVDSIISSITKKSYSALNQIEKVEFVRKLVDGLRNDSNENTSTKKNKM